MSQTINIPCSSVILPTKGDLTNIFIQLANSQNKEIQELLDEIDSLLGNFPITVSKPLYSSLDIPELEWEKKITAILQEYHLFVQVKILELINDIIPISFEIPIPGLGIDIDILKFFSDPNYIITLKAQIVKRVDILYNLIPDPYRTFDGEYGFVSDDLKLEVVMSYIMSKLNKGALGLIHDAAGKLIEKFDEIWSALGLPDLPTLTDLSIENIIKELIDSLRDDLRDASNEEKEKIRKEIIELLEEIEVVGFKLMDILGGKPNEFIISDERTMDRFMEALRDFGENWPKYLIQEWLNKVKKFLDAIGLGKILDFVFFDFCDFLTLIGLPKTINLTTPITIAPLLNPGKNSLPGLTRNITPLSGDPESRDVYTFTRVKDQSIIGGLDNQGSFMTLNSDPFKVLVDNILTTEFTREGNNIILQNSTNVNQNIVIIV